MVYAAAVALASCWWCGLNLGLDLAPLRVSDPRMPPRVGLFPHSVGQDALRRMDDIG